MIRLPFGWALATLRELRKAADDHRTTFTQVRDLQQEVQAWKYMADFWEEYAQQLEAQAQELELEVEDLRDHAQGTATYEL